MITEKDMVSLGGKKGYPYLNGRGTTPFEFPSGKIIYFDVNYMHYKLSENVEINNERFIIENVEQFKKLL